MKLTPDTIRICRTTLRLTQGKLARMAGISCPLLGAIERGERPLLPHVEKKIRAAIPLTDEEIEELVRINQCIASKVV